MLNLPITHELGNMKKFARITLLMILMSMACQVQAAKIYTCVVNGDTLYTSKPQGNCSSADLPSIGSYTSASYQPAVAPAVAPVYKEPKPKTAKKAPIRSSNEPAVAQTPPPVKASGSRRQILEQELANERSALSVAQKTLTAGRSVSGQNNTQHQGNVRQLESAVLDRQQNIQALQRELGRM